MTVFVAGISASGQRTVDALRAMAAAERVDDLHIEITDVADHPAKADEARIVATPTVIRVAPEPRVRLVGDLSPPEVRARVSGLLFDQWTPVARSVDAARPDA